MAKKQKYIAHGSFKIEFEAEGPRLARRDAYKIIEWINHLSSVKFSGYVVDVKPALNVTDKVAGRW